MWSFRGIRALAIDRLTKEEMGPIEQVLLAKQYSVPQWLRTGCDALAVRSEMLSVEEAGQLSYPTAILVFQVREQVREQVRACPTTIGSDAYSIIGRVFDKELLEMEIAYNQYWHNDSWIDGEALLFLERDSKY